ncbi:M50 family metallopeptidase [Hellea balneolensis]|uniref:M50 family metallopeptidase n=1 Tax=Hellea balneolensis TaxID=287478 RepID=UPI00040FB3D8|nr:M50 family metallopeptidase [Hellea balneolensis]
MLSGLGDTFIFMTSFLVVLSFLVYFHELGHYSVARFFNVAVERFSIGFGKPIAQWTAKNGTKWSIGRIPLGGFVKFLGDASGASNPDAEALEKLKNEVRQEGDVPLDQIFHFKPVWQRILIVLAGPVFNFILAVGIFAGLGLAMGSYYVESKVGQVVPDSAAEAAGVKVGDKIMTMDGKDVSDFNELRRYVVLRSGNKIETIVERDGREVELFLTPRRVVEKDFVGGNSSAGKIGIGIAADAEQVPIKFNPIEAVGFGVAEVKDTIAMTGHYIGRIFTRKEDGKQLGSIVKIATMTGKSAVDAANADVPFSERIKMILLRLLTLAASLSIALGVANLMPIPVLDGGHLVYYGYEAVAGRPLSQKKQEIGFRFGFAVLLTLFVILTVNDIGYVASIFS